MKKEDDVFGEFKLATESTSIQISAHDFKKIIDYFENAGFRITICGMYIKFILRGTPNSPKIRNLERGGIEILGNMGIKEKGDIHGPRKDS